MLATSWTYQEKVAQGGAQLLALLPWIAALHPLRPLRRAPRAPRSCVNMYVLHEPHATPEKGRDCGTECW